MITPVRERRLHLQYVMTEPGKFKRGRYIRLLFQQLPGAIWTTDRDLNLTYVAGRLANNMSPQAKPGTSICEVLDTRDPANRAIASHRAALAGEPQSFEYKVRGRWYKVFIEQLTDDSGKVAGCIGAAYDITEQRATQERLARSEAMLAQAQRLAHIGSFEWDIATNLVTWSDELCRIQGLEPCQFGGTYEAFLNRIHPDDLERTKSAIFDALRQGSPIVYEHRIIRPDGKVRVLQTRGDTITDKDGRPVKMAGCSWDITELREAMDCLERARSLLEATIEATADGLLVVDLEGRVTAYNRQFLSLWHIPEDLALHRDDQKLLAYVCDQVENPQQFLWSTHELYRNPERESFDTLHFKDGRRFERYSRPQRIGERIAGRVWSFRDITEREKLLQRALFLADATRLLSSLDVEPALDSVAHLAVPFIGDGCAIDLLGNGHPRRLLLVTRDGTEPLNPELQSAVMAGHSAIFSMGTRSCMAVPLVVKEAVEGSMTFIGPPVRRYEKSDLELAETLASRAALSVENAKLYRKAREALKARDEFLTIAAHEIRGPITSIHLAVQGLQLGKASTEAMTKLFEIIEHEDRKLRRFVDELIDLDKIQSGQMYFNFEDVDLGEVVHEAASTLGSDLARSGSALSITTEGRPAGQWDKYGLAQVATNLLSNAIKFGEGKPITVTVREDEGRTTLAVKDQGIGMHSEMLGRIFNPFERGVSVRNYGGLGLGLYIVRTIVEGLGGVVQVESKPKEGSTFTVELRNERTV
jgi:PAS domain S-box-containing protein